MTMPGSEHLANARYREKLLRILSEGDLTPEGQKRLSAIIAETDERAVVARGALAAIARWADFYPVDVFPEPTFDEFKRADEALCGIGMRLDAISAGIYRRVLSAAKTLALAGLGGGD